VGRRGLGIKLENWKKEYFPDFKELNIADLKK
jgi:hypothetical protein